MIMILFITPSDRSEECAHALETGTGQPTQVAGSLEVAISYLRSQEYSAVVLDQFLLESDPEQCEQMLQHLGGAVPIHVNCAISGIERIVREVCSALGRSKREQEMARWSAEKAMWSDLSESVTAIVLSCDLALATPDMPTQAAEELRVVQALAHQIRARLEHTISGNADLD